MRPPVSAIEPRICGVSTSMRRDLPSASPLLGALRAAGDGLRLLLRLRLFLLLEVGQSEVILPDQQHEPGEHDRQYGVLALVHRVLSSSVAGRRFACVWARCGCRALFSCTCRSARSNAASNCGNGRASAALRPITT